MHESVSAVAHLLGGEESAEASESDSGAELLEAAHSGKASQECDPGPLMKWDRPIIFR